MLLGVRALILASVAVMLPTTAFAQSDELQIVRPDELSVRYSDKQADAGTVWIRNTSDRPVPLGFTANVQDGDGKGFAVVASAQTSVIQPNSVERFRIRLDAVDQGRLDGELVVYEAKSAADREQATSSSVAPASVPLEIGPKRDVTSWINGLLLLPLIVAAVFIGVRWQTIQFPRVNLGSRLGPAKFDFSKSFASTITIVGALLGTAVTAGVLPEEPAHLTKDEYILLNLVFGVAVVVAGVVFAASEKPSGNPEVGKEREYRGSVRALLLAAALVVWASVGQAGCLALLISELHDSPAFTDVAIVAFYLLLIIAVVEVLRYTFKRIYWVIENKAEVPSTAEGAPEQAAGTWPFF